MKAISNTAGSLFFNTASAGPMTGVWSAPFLAPARRREVATTNRAARRQLRNLDLESNLWHESVARAVLVLTVVSAYAAAIWQIGSF